MEDRVSHTIKKPKTTRLNILEEIYQEQVEVKKLKCELTPFEELVS